MKKIILWIGVGLVVLVVAALAVVFFSLNTIVKKGVETGGSQLTKVDVRLGAAKISPFSGSGQLTQFFVGNPPGYKSPSAIQVGDLKVAVKIGSVFSDTIVVDEINIQSPEITLEGTTSENNLGKIMDNLKSTNAPAPTAKESAPKSEKKFIIKDFVLSNAKVNLNVSGFGKSLVQSVTIPDVHLQNIGTAGNAVTPEQMAQQILQPILTSAAAAATQQLADKGIQHLEQQGTKELNKALQGGVSNLLKK